MHLAMELAMPPDFSKCREARMQPSIPSLLAELKACSGSRDLKRVKLIHADVIDSGNASDLYISSTLVSLYAKCGAMQEAQAVFDAMQYRDVVSWNALIFGYACNGQGQVAIQFLASMEKGPCPPNAACILSALKACTGMLHGSTDLDKLVQLGMAVHSRAAIASYLSDVYVSNALVNFYSKASRLTSARRVFDTMQPQDVATWNAMMFGYVDNGEGWPALNMFRLLQQEGYVPDGLSFVAAFKAFTCLAAIEEPKKLGGKLVKAGTLAKAEVIHQQANMRGFGPNVYVGSTLIDMYSACGAMDDARRVYNNMLRHDVVSWTALMMGYAENGEGEPALELYTLRRPEGCQPNGLTFVAALKACSVLGALGAGRDVHAELRERGYETHPLVATTLVDFYGKCGSMNEAQQAFDDLVYTRDVVAWNALMAGYSRQGDSQRVLDLFCQMRDRGLQPDSSTFVCLLTACSHAGLVDEGTKYFDSMQPRYGVKPGLQHYHCMIDILGRSNQLEAAVSMLHEMPYPPDAVAWRIILSACHKWNNVTLGKLAFDSLLEFDDGQSSNLVLMANTWERANVLRPCL